MNIDPQIYYWAHMLDESKHASYYEVYMQEHPEDKLETLIDSLIEEFAKSLKKDHINLKKCLSKGKVNVVYLDDLQKKIKTHYVWEKIKAQTYGAIISRMTALLHRSGNQKFNEADEIGYDDVTHLVSRKVVEDCLDIICHNTNVLEANNEIVNNAHQYEASFKRHGIPALMHYDEWERKWTEDYFAAVQLYKAWASYAKGNAGEPYVCDSAWGPSDLRKRLNATEYSADTIDLIVLLNKCLDVVHFRSDLAAAFIEGGQQTCALVSNLPSRFVI